MPEAKMDTEMQAFANDVLASIRQMKRGEGPVTMPEQVMARRRRPVGSVQAVTKRPTTLCLDESALQRWRASGKGWRTRFGDP